MKTLLIAISFFFAFSQSNFSNSNQVQNVELICQDYWAEYVYINGILYFNEYCGDKLFHSTPVID